MIDIKNVKANGISFNPNYPEIQNYKSIIEAAVSVFRMRYDTNQILNMINEISSKDDYHFGHRFNDNSSVATRAISAVCSSAFNDIEYGNQPSAEDIETAKNNIIQFFETINGEKMDYLIIDAMRDCASADHWYTYEKQWD